MACYLTAKDLGRGADNFGRRQPNYSSRLLIIFGLVNVKVSGVAACYVFVVIQTNFLIKCLFYKAISEEVKKCFIW